MSVPGRVRGCAEAGVAHHGIKENEAGQSLDLFDPDGHEIELTYEY